MPFLPVLSAISCSAQSGNPTMSEPSAVMIALSRPSLAASTAPSHSAGLSVESACNSGAASAAWSSRSAMSAPARPDGTRPNAVSALYRPPTFGSARNVLR